MSTHGRSASLGGGGWFSGTMEVISGMAPRPSTPQGSLPPGGNMNRGSMSAPNSPARPGFFPSITRLPSQDSLDRSNHNESGHGKSTAQIIRDLKHANASLSAKQASQEAQFMNQLGEVQKSFEDGRVKMEGEIKSMKKQLVHLEAYKAAADSKLKEKDASLSKVKEESAFQRHTISDLKNQLYQLQSELDESETTGIRDGGMSIESRKEMEQLLMDNQEMARELARLQGELRDSERARHDAERSAGLGRPPTPSSVSGESSSNSYYHKYQETHSELERQRKRLTVTQSTLEGLEAEKTSLQEKHAKTLEELQEELGKQSQLFGQREQELQARIETLEFAESQVTLELKQELEQRNETIADMQEQLEQYADKAAELSVQLNQAEQAAANQENYRRDEAEDLRILHDAQEEEITKLRKKLDDSQKEVELRDAELSETSARLVKLDGSQRSGNIDNSQKDENIELLQMELKDSQDELASAKAELASLQNGVLDTAGVLALRQELEASTKTASALREELETVRSEQEQQMKEAKVSIESLMKEKDEISEKLVSMEKGKGDTVLGDGDEIDYKFSNLRSKWVDKAEAAQEAEALKNEIEIHKQRVHDVAGNEKVANAKIQELSQKVEWLESELEAQRKQTDESTQAVEQSGLSSDSEDQEKTKQALEAAKIEITRLRSTLEEYEAGSSKTKKQLREAQIALVALDDEKKEMLSKHRELLSAVEQKKEEIHRASEKMLATKDSEIQSLQSELAEAKFFEAEKDSLEKRVKSLESSGQVAPLEPMTSSPSPSEMDTVRFEEAVRSLTEEKEALKTKLKDRDTTIAALVKSSMSLEKKITNMESDLQDVRSVQSEEKKMTDGEIYQLRRTLSALKDKEPKVAQEVAVLKKDLKAARTDAARWKKALQEDGSTGSEYRFQLSLLQKALEDNSDRLKERDQAIENLVNQSMSQDSHVKSLKTRISSLMKEVETVRSQRARFDDGALKAEIHRLQQETEMFAGQIIEQDEELQKLRRLLKQRDDQILSIKRELAELKANGGASDSGRKHLDEIAGLKLKLAQVSSSLKSRETQLEQVQKQLQDAHSNPNTGANPREVLDLQAELDELREANTDNRTELRDLRKQLWDAKQGAGEANDLRLELAQAKYAFEEYKRTFGISGSSEEDLKTIEKLKAEIEVKEATITDLEKNSSSLNEEQVSIFQTELDNMRLELSQKTEAMQELFGELKARDSALEKSESLKLKLVTELSATKEQLAKLDHSVDGKESGVVVDSGDNSLMNEKAALLLQKEELNMEVAELKKRIEAMANEESEQSRQAREASELSIVEAYEKRISAVNTEKDVTIDQLRHELAESRGSASENNHEMVIQLQSLHAENEGLKEQFEVELQAKNQQIYALEHTLHAQEQIVESMRAEMDQLQSGMEHATEKRRGEVDGLQQDLMQLEGRSLKQEREITALKMQLEESKLEHKAEVVRLKDEIANIEKESPLAKTVADLQRDDRMLEVRERLEQLKARNTSLQEQNLKLGGRLERSVIEVKALEFEKERAKDMEKENESLRRQVKELESILQGSRQQMVRTSSTGSSRSSASSSASSARGAPSSSSSTANKENPSKSTNTKPPKPAKKKGLKGLFKRRGFSSDDVIKEEETSTK